MFDVDKYDVDFERIGREVTGMGKGDFYTLEEVCCPFLCLFNGPFQ